MNDDQAMAATPHSELLADLMNPNNPKNDREHAAVREIERLQEAQLQEQPKQRNVTKQEHDVLMKSIKASSKVVFKGFLAQPVQERNFCPRCGKRLSGVGSIHTCTPPKELNT